MKRVLSAVIILLVIGAQSYSQKKAGTIYSEHENLDKVKALWKAFQDGDRDVYQSFFADSVLISSNGDEGDILCAKDVGGAIRWWTEEIENFKIQDHKPAYPDALEYKSGAFWVQDWLLFTGRHTETGINFEMPVHGLYSFNKEGKINMMSMYFTDEIFENIEKNLETNENGKVYINHPYILKVRQLVNAVIDKDVDKYASFFTENATFRASWDEWGEYRTLDEELDNMKENFKNSDIKQKIEQQGYPDCVYYALNDGYTVYSWWKVTNMRGDKKVTYSLMLAHTFNNDGMITSEAVYGSTNHMQKLQ